LVSLQHLSLSSNWLEGLGHSFALLCDLTHLTRLNLANISTRKQPLVISTMVLQLQQLRELDVSNNAACEECDEDESDGNDVLEPGWCLKHVQSSWYMDCCGVLHGGVL
ncbi:hypothetical protein HaLaN_31820, partial [Haematococcus lacustris]